MPNWCMNKIKASGRDSRIQEFFDFVNEEIDETENCKFSFNKIIPMPKELLENPYPSDQEKKDNFEKFGFESWYEWSCANWGTKWNASEIVINNEPDIKNYEIIFNSAWSPPIPIFQRIMELYPELTFDIHYCEIGESFAGHVYLEDGIVINNWMEDDRCVNQIAYDEFGMSPSEFEEDELER